MGTHSDLRGEVANVFRLWLFLSLTGVWKAEAGRGTGGGRKGGGGEVSYFNFVFFFAHSSPYNFFFMWRCRLGLRVGDRRGGCAKSEEGGKKVKTC